MDPPFWYAGMKNHELQVMFYGKDIAQAEFSLKSYPGVKVKEVAKVKNPNYLIVYLDVTDKARPGTMTFRFKEGRTVTEKAFELRPRNTKTGAQGFSTKDVLYLIMPDRFANGNPTAIPRTMTGSSSRPTAGTGAATTAATCRASGTIWATSTRSGSRPSGSIRCSTTGATPRTATRSRTST